jgi:two-component system, NtrC family, sensor histidine kinase PilS
VAVESSAPPKRAAVVYHPILSRRLAYIALVRVILFTLILGGTVAVNFAWGTPEELGGRYVTLLFVFIAAMLLVSILYAVLMRSRRLLRPLAVVQVVADLVIGAALVHFTGGANSSFSFFLLLTPIAAAVTLSRRAAVVSAAAVAVVYAAVVLLGFAHWLPVLPGQTQLPWLVKPGELGRTVLVTTAASLALAALAGYLAEQLRSAAATVEVQKAHIDDLALLNTDIIRCLTSGLITVNTDGVILSMNRSAADILGLSHTVAGQRLAELVPELAAAAATGEEVRRAEIPVTRARPPSELLLGISLSPLTDHLNRRQGSIISFQDLTSFNRLEEAMRRSEHLASLGRMAAGIAHEIRNPLASISGSLELLRSAQHLEADDRKLMDIALREIERLDALITGFLGYARPRPPQLETINLGTEIETLVGSIAGLISGDHVPKVRVIEATPGLWVNADRDQLTSVLWNLIRNAWESGETEQIEVAAGRQEDQRVYLLVTDRGSGIAEEHLPKIFEPFFTTKPGGTGLGLATVHRMIQQHGGCIEVRSAPGQGTTFTLLLPPAPPPAEAATLEASPEPGTPVDRG